MYFGMSVSPSYLEATVTTARSGPRERPDLEVLVNISQMTVSQMGLTEMTDSPQQRQQWLCEQVLNWSGLPVVNVDPRSSSSTLFSRIGRRNRLPGTRQFACRLEPDAPRRAGVIAAILVSPTAHIGKVYELTGPRSQNMHGVAAEYSEALGRPIRYVDVPFDQWRDQVVRTHNLSDHVSEHFLTMAASMLLTVMIVSRMMSRQSSEGPQRTFVTLWRSTGSSSTGKWQSPDAVAASEAWSLGQVREHGGEIVTLPCVPLTAAAMDSRGTPIKWNEFVVWIAPSKVLPLLRASTCCDCCGERAASASWPSIQRVAYSARGGV